MSSEEADIRSAIVGAVAEAEGVSSLDLDVPLGEYIDLDAVADLYANSNAAWELVFEAEGHEVRVAHTGEIRVDGRHYHDPA